MLRVEPGQLLAHQVTLVQQRRSVGGQLVQPAPGRLVASAGRRRDRLAHLGQHAQPLPVARPPREGEALDVPRQPDARRQHDAGVLPGRIEPGDAAVGQEREVEGHSITLIRSRSSRGHLELLLVDRPLQPVPQFGEHRRPLVHRPASARRYCFPSCFELPCTRRSRSRRLASKAP